MSSIYQRTLFPTSAANNSLHDDYDIVIIFHSAEVQFLIDQNIGGYPNPYFMAKIDDKISFTSTTLFNTSRPMWSNEEWIIRNVPANAKLSVTIYDKKDEKLVDNYIGEFEILNIINYSAPSGGHAIVGSFNRHNGRFHLSIDSTKSSNENKQLPRYTFDGPCRYSRHDSLADCNYSTWRIQLRRISFFFPPDEHQQQNQQYKPAHQILYERTLKLNETGRLTDTDDLWKLIFLDRTTQKIQACAYNYIIDENTWQFSEIGRQWLTNSEIKHTRLANSSESVRFAGEFHIRPRFGWNRLDDEWELVFDNASGTYSPNGNLLVNLKQLLLFNFPNLNIVTYDYKDPRLKDSLEQLEMATRKYKRIVPHSSFT